MVNCKIKIAQSRKALSYLRQVKSRIELLLLERPGESQE